jgi:hypothetical protein
MGAIFVCGGECGATAVCAGHWDTLTSTAPALETSIIEPGGGATSYKWVGTGVNHSLSHTIAQTTVAARVYFRFDTFPAGGTTFFQLYQSADGGGMVKSNGSKLYIRMGASAADVTVSSTLTTGGWHYLDVKLDASGTTTYLYARLDGGTEVSDSLVKVSANVTAIRHGFMGSTATGTVYIDQILVAAAADYPLGPGAVGGYRPTSDGTHTATGTNLCKGTTAVPVGTAITSATTDAWQWADAATISTTGSFWRQSVISAAQYVEVGFGTIAVAPLAVEVLVSLSASAATANTQKAVLWDGVTAVDMYALATVGASHPTLAYKRAIYTASMSGAWTAALFNALHFRWGYSTDVTPFPYLDNVVLEVAFVAASGFSGTGAVASAASANAGTAGETFSGTGAVASAASAIAGTGIGAPSFTGAGAVALPSANAGTGGETFTGAAAVALPSASAGTGLAGAIGSGAVAVASASVGTGAEKFSGSGAIAAGSTSTGAGIGAPGFSGTGAVAFGSANAGAAAETFAGTGAVARLAASAGTAAETFAGTGTIASVAANAGTGLAGMIGSGAVARPSASSGTGTETFAGSGAVARPSANAGAGIGAPGFSGTGAVARPSASAGTGAEVFSGSGSVAVGIALAGTGSVVLNIVGVGAVAIGSVSAGVADMAFRGSGAAAFAAAMAGAGGQTFLGAGGITSASSSSAAGLVTVPPLIGLAARMRISTEADQLAIASAPGMSARSVSDAPVITSARAIP